MAEKVTIERARKPWQVLGGLCLRPFKWFWGLSWFKKITIAIVVVVVGSVGMLEVTSQPFFCNSCHIMNDYYANWKTSTHSDVNCLSCHLQPGVAGFVKGKINGLAQAVDCMVGRVGTKPNAKVEDASCLRSHCHLTETLTADTVQFGTVKFAHEKHIDREVDGIPISCGTCHSHFEGDKHFEVNTQVCYTCHFLKSSKTNEKLVNTGCLDCHEVPDKEIKRGMVNVNHKEFVSYEANCNDSCHKKDVEKEIEMSPTVCLNCHSESMGNEVDSVLLHQAHNHGHIKVECFACHGEVIHKRTEYASVTAMMDCKNCHRDTHGIQKSVFSAHDNPAGGNSDRILSPMFLTHVECNDCHIEPRTAPGGALSSMGTVVRPTPEACDRCHEKGTGQRYIPFWQGQIKKMHENISKLLSDLEERTAIERDQQTLDELNKRLSDAKVLLDSVEQDGSWGVHNLKYTEALLVKARNIINEAD